MLNGAAILMNGVGTLNGVYAIFLVSLHYKLTKYLFDLFLFCFLCRKNKTAKTFQCWK